MIPKDIYLQNKLLSMVFIGETNSLAPFFYTTQDTIPFKGALSPLLSIKLVFLHELNACRCNSTKSYSKYSK